MNDFKSFDHGSAGPGPGPVREPHRTEPSRTLSTATGGAEPSISSRIEYPVRTRGLCINCEHRGRCPFPVPEGGVWHCEEYE